MQFGARSYEVNKLQLILSQFPDIYLDGLVTGYFGPLTQNAVKRFQVKEGIKVDGIIGSITRAKLNELIKSDTSSVGIVGATGATGATGDRGVTGTAGIGTYNIGNASGFSSVAGRTLTFTNSEQTMISTGNIGSTTLKPTNIIPGTVVKIIASTTGNNRVGSIAISQ